ncbi:type VI secretion system Vgr family protein [Variovorax boronicumulans]|uniref:type VI secretion system Vgr family protein n=1 Tax=Variovorax boronicumulans TaxID=436515 RepID=UPI00214A964E
MKALSRTLEVKSVAIPQFSGRPALEPVRLSGCEGLDRLFAYELWLKTPEDLNLGASEAIDWDLDSFIGHEISCRIELDGSGQFVPGRVGRAVDGLGAGVRQVNALITAAELWGEEGRDIQYKLTLRPWLYLATLSIDCKIYQNKTVAELLDELLGDYPFSVEKRFIATYPSRDFQTQFNESDFDFFVRLTQENGINFFFEHDDDKHRLVLIDNKGALGAQPSAAYREVDYHPPGWKTDAEYISSFVPHHRLTSGRYTTRDYDYTRPRADLSVSHSDPRPTGQAEGEVYQWHASPEGAHFVQPSAGTGEPNDPLDEGRNFALLRMQALRTHGARARASGNLRGMQPGSTFRLRKHPQQKANTEYLVLDSVLVIEDVAASSQRIDAAIGRTQRWQVSCDFTVHPMSEPLRPALTQPKPHTHGPQVALVVGPEGQNIWTDALGRIKVQFPWDRIGGKNQHATCWLRVNYSGAGNQLGSIQIPRIGQEVIVDFIGGDPDLPFCLGQLHNQMNLPPWQLPGQSALSGFRSRELVPDGGNAAAGRSNHLVLDDTASRIQVQLKSDHQHSQLSLGHIARIEDNAGRTDLRGEGFELRTDAHGAVRARQGLLITTEGRERARAHVKHMDETLQRLVDARDRHEALADLARHHQTQDADQDQAEVSRQLKAQNDALQGAGRVDVNQGRFPEMAAPHLVLASAEGLGATVAGTLHLAAGAHVATTSAGHTSIGSGKSLLASAMEAIRLFANKAGIRLFAAQGAVQVQAQDDMIELIAKKAVELISTTDWIHLKAKEGISLEAAGSAFKIDAQGFRFYTPAAHHVWAADHQTFGPKALLPPLPQLPRSVCVPCLLKAAKAGSALTRF